MGIRTHLGTPKGAYDERVDGDSDVVVESAVGSTKTFLYSDTSGKVATANLASRVRYEYWDHSIGGQSIPTASYTTIQINGGNDSVVGGLSTWNTGSHVFRPEAIGNVYTLRFTGKVTAPGKNGTIHVDLALSGATPPLFVTDYNRLKQGYEFDISSKQDHVDVVAVYTMFTDQRSFFSGCMFYMTTDIVGGATLMSASVFIKEG